MFFLVLIFYLYPAALMQLVVVYGIHFDPLPISDQCHVLAATHKLPYRPSGASLFPSPKCR